MDLTQEQIAAIALAAVHEMRLQAMRAAAKGSLRARLFPPGVSAEDAEKMIALVAGVHEGVERAPRTAEARLAQAIARVLLFERPNPDLPAITYRELAELERVAAEAPRAPFLSGPGVEFLWRDDYGEYYRRHPPPEDAEEW